MKDKVFPTFEEHEPNPTYSQYRKEFVPDGGLTKRELFAAMAMKGLLSNEMFMNNTRGVTEQHSVDHAAEVAVVSADTLLAELEKQK